MPSSDFDITYHRSGSYEEADRQFNYWKTRTPPERLAAACQLIAEAWQSGPHDKMDRTVFSMRKHAQ